MSLEDQYIELQHAKYDVIDAFKTNSGIDFDACIERLKEACEKICFDYEGELQHCKDIAYEDRI